MKKLLARVEQLAKSRDPEVQRVVGKIAQHIGAWGDLQLILLPEIEKSAKALYELFNDRLQELQDERYDVLEIADMVATVVGAARAFEDGQAGLETALEYYDSGMEKLAHIVAVGPRE